MSIPQDVVLQVLKELPAKSLLRFKCVSKDWCSMIEDPDFVNLHRIRSYDRPGGIGFLVRHHDHDVDSYGDSSEMQEIDEITKCFLVYSQDKFVPVPAPAQVSQNDFSPNHWQVVEGLVYFDNFIWNPSTRKVIELPLKDVNFDLVMPAGRYLWTFQNKYFLGFDTLAKKHKILSVFSGRHARRESEESRYIRFDDGWSDEEVILAETLTLGNDSWERIDGPLPDQLSEVFNLYSDSVCSINNVIYLKISGAIIAFHVSREKFAYMSLPDSFVRCSDLDSGSGSVIEVKERLALVDSLCTKIWILEDLENRRWNEVDLIFPDSWKVVLRYYDEDDGFHVQVPPVGSIPTGEILFGVRHVDNQGRTEKLVCFCHNMKQNNSIRMLGKLKGYTCYKDSIFPKHVETIIPLHYKCHEAQATSFL